jgi:hypothetical protein
MPIESEIDKVDRYSWDHLLTQFDDASLYQTWSFGTSAGARSVSHIVLKDGEEILACCQVCLRRLPFCNIGIADIVWGPLYMKKGGDLKRDVLSHLVRGIKEEYAIRRGHLLRIWPHAIGERKELLKQILESEGFRRIPSERPYQTLILDLSSSLEDLRKNFLQKWRNCLNKAERANLTVVEGTNDDLFKIFVMLSNEMRERKNLTTGIDNEAYRRIQKDLPERLKMKIMVCEADSEPVCAAICAAIGNTGVYILGATGHKGLQLNGSYLLQWRIIQRLKENGIRYYDLGGIDAELNPGVYQFKRGVVGKNGWEEVFLGGFHGCFTLSGRIARLLLECWKFVRKVYRK